jgi:uncharacterized Zn finger protein (UPF0148 family)
MKNKLFIQLESASRKELSEVNGDALIDIKCEDCGSVSTVNMGAKFCPKCGSSHINSIEDTNNTTQDTDEVESVSIDTSDDDVIMSECTCGKAMLFKSSDKEVHCTSCGKAVATKAPKRESTAKRKQSRKGKQFASKRKTATRNNVKRTNAKSSVRKSITKHKNVANTKRTVVCPHCYASKSVSITALASTNNPKCSSCGTETIKEPGIYVVADDNETITQDIILDALENGADIETINMNGEIISDKDKSVIEGIRDYIANESFASTRTKKRRNKSVASRKFNRKPTKTRRKFTASSKHSAQTNRNRPRTYTRKRYARANDMEMNPMNIGVDNNMSEFDDVIIETKDTVADNDILKVSGNADVVYVKVIDDTGNVIQSIAELTKDTTNYPETFGTDAYMANLQEALDQAPDFDSKLGILNEHGFTVYTASVKASVIFNNLQKRHLSNAFSEISNQYAHDNNDFIQCLELGAKAINTNFYREIENPIIKKLVASLSGLVEDDLVESLAIEAINESGDEYISQIVDTAKKFSEMSVTARNEIAKTMASINLTNFNPAVAKVSKPANIGNTGMFNFGKPANSNSFASASTGGGKRLRLRR